MRAGITELMQSRGFLSFKWAQGKTLWFIRRRDGIWVDAFCFEIYSDDEKFSLAFGVEYVPIRDLSLGLAKKISPAIFSGTLLRSLGIVQRPCTNIFAATSGTGFEFSNVRASEGIVEEVDANFFCKIKSENDYLNFLAHSESSFAWGRSAAAFRLIYIGFLFRRQGVLASEYRNYCSRIPEKFLESHVLLSSAGLSASDFIETCIELIWSGGT